MSLDDLIRKEIDDLVKNWLEDNDLEYAEINVEFFTDDEPNILRSDTE